MRVRVIRTNRFLEDIHDVWPGMIGTVIKILERYIVVRFDGNTDHVTIPVVYIEEVKDERSERTKASPESRYE